MKKIEKHLSFLKLAFYLSTASLLLYALHFWLFQDLHHIFLYLVGDIAFLPVDVLIVTLILHKMLQEQEKKKVFQKLNMVIGVFFSEVGRELLEFCVPIDQNTAQLSPEIQIHPQTTEKDFRALIKKLKQYEPALSLANVDLNLLRDRLMAKREFLIKLLENPSLLEHETFTDLLQAIFHLEEELSMRKNLDHLSEKDLLHLAVDFQRFYRLLVLEWGLYLKHLKKSYPFLYSFALRTNPFDPTSRVEF